MKCRKAQKLIDSYAELNSPQKERLDEHLHVCPDCSHELTLHQNSIHLLKEVTHFEETEDFWVDYQVDLKRKIPDPPIWRRMWTKMEKLTGFIVTPVLGPVPAYVFSLVIVVLVALSLYSGVLGPKTAQAFNNNLVVYEGNLLSAADDGGVTIYTLGSR
jgi:hypothetical protein